MQDECIRDEPMCEERGRNQVLEPISNHNMVEKSYKEPRMSLLKQWEVHIKVLNVGCIINVGCKAFAFSTIEEGLKELQDYYKDPLATNEKWSKIENKLNHVN